MKRLIEVESICPFVGKPCIKDGWTWNASIFHPCAFWDSEPYDTEAMEEPCRIKRALNCILAAETQGNDDEDENEVRVPF